MKTTNLTLLLNQQQLSISEMKNVKGGAGGNCTAQSPEGPVGGLTEAEAKASGHPYSCENVQQN